MATIIVGKIIHAKVKLPARIDVPKCRKITKDRWIVDTKGTSKIEVSYHYYANELNAGSTYLDDQQLYVNPVNCCVYTDSSFNKPVTFELDIPKNWKVAGSMDSKDNGYIVANFDELFDTPFIASGILQHLSFHSGETLFHIWFNGEVKVDEERILKDFKAFTDAQMKKFTEFPANEYHFLNHIDLIKHNLN